MESINLKKILILRMSSLGDIVQALEVPTALKKRFPEAQVHWVVRSDFADLPQAHPHIDKVWLVHREKAWAGLWSLIQQLKLENYDGIYDAHSNLRSHLICLFLKTPYFVRRSKERFKRWLLFSFSINKFPWPYKGALSFLQPLKKWGVPCKVSENQRLKLSAIDTYKAWTLIAPSAAWEMKRWPLEHWLDLVKNISGPIGILGGPDDKFCEEIALVDPHRIKNLAGQLTWQETTSAISSARLVISGDTGVLHIADFLGVKTVALIGPTAFGFPSRPSSQVAEVKLSCRPCTKDGRGRCKNSIYKKCLVDISPQQVEQIAQKLLQGPTS